MHFCSRCFKVKWQCFALPSKTTSETLEFAAKSHSRVFLFCLSVVETKGDEPRVIGKKSRKVVWSSSFLFRYAHNLSYRCDKRCFRDKSTPHGVLFAFPPFFRVPSPSIRPMRCAPYPLFGRLGESILWGRKRPFIPPRPPHGPKQTLTTGLTCLQANPVNPVQNHP